MDIVEEIRQDREKGAKRLEGEYKAGLMALARRFCTNPSDAEELVNATFATVVANIDDYLEQSAFFAWMCQILMSLHSRNVRRKSNQEIVYPGTVADAVDEAAEEEIYRNLDRALVRDALQTLEAEDREILLLHYFLDIPIVKMAKVLAIPAGTVKSRLHYARRALAAKLGVAAHKPGGKAVILTLALGALTALGAGAGLAVVRLLSSPSVAVEQQADNGNDAGQATGNAQQQAENSTATSSATDCHRPPATDCYRPSATENSFSATQGENMNKTTLLAASAAIMAASATMPVGAYTVTTNGATWTYIMNNDGVNTVTLGPGTATATGTCTDSDRAIPAATSVSASLIPWVFENGGDTYTVTRVNKYAFYKCTNMTGTLTIPDAVTEVGERAFSDIGTSITRVASLGGVTTLGNYAFSSLQPLGDFPDLYNITTFNTGAFQYWSKLTGSANVVLNPSVSSIPARTFYGAKITGVKIPRSVTSVGFYSFSSTLLPGLLIPGPLTAASSSQYTSIDALHLLQYTSTLKVFFAGPNTKVSISSTYEGDMFAGSTDCKVFVPANGRWNGITEANAGGTRTKVIKYGPGEEIDFALDTEEKVITAKPTTEAAFTNALNWATLFRDKLGYRTRISVTNSIEVAADAVTPEMLANVEIDSTLMMFAVKTQAQLDSVLDAVPQTTMLAIDPTGATKRLELPPDRALWVWLSGSGEYRPYVRGLIITFH